MNGVCVFVYVHVGIVCVSFENECHLSSNHSVALFGERHEEECRAACVDGQSCNQYDDERDSQRRWVDEYDCVSEEE